MNPEEEEGCKSIRATGNGRYEKNRLSEIIEQGSYELTENEAVRTESTHVWTKTSAYIL